MQKNIYMWSYFLFIHFQFVANAVGSSFVTPWDWYSMVMVSVIWASWSSTERCPHENLIKCAHEGRSPVHMPRSVTSVTYSFSWKLHFPQQQREAMKSLSNREQFEPDAEEYRKQQDRAASFPGPPPKYPNYNMVRMKKKEQSPYRTISSSFEGPIWTLDEISHCMKEEKGQCSEIFSGRSGNILL